MCFFYIIFIIESRSAALFFDDYRFSSNVENDRRGRFVNRPYGGMFKFVCGKRQQTGDIFLDMDSRLRVCCTTGDFVIFRQRRIRLWRTSEA